MKLSIMQPYLFPYIGYFQLINAVDKFVVYDDVNFIKKGWINRNCILVNGQRHTFTVPLLSVSQNKLIKEMKINFDERWAEKFLKCITQSYKKAKYFDETFDLISQIVYSGETLISKMILRSLNILREKLELHTELVVSSEVYNSQELKGQYRILEICKRENASQYINPSGGMELYNRKLFADNGIKLSFLQPAPFSYKQFNNEFIPNLSIIDVLMFNGFVKTKKFLSLYVLS